MEITRMPTRLKSMGILYFWLCWDNKYIVPTKKGVFLSPNEHILQIKQDTFGLRFLMAN